MTTHASTAAAVAVMTFMRAPMTVRLLRMTSDRDDLPNSVLEASLEVVRLIFEWMLVFRSDVGEEKEGKFL